MQALLSRENLHMQVANPTSATEVNRQSCTYNAASHSAAYLSLQDLRLPSSTAGVKVKVKVESTCMGHMAAQRSYEQISGQL